MCITTERERQWLEFTVTPTVNCLSESDGCERKGGIATLLPRALCEGQDSVNPIISELMSYTAASI